MGAIPDTRALLRYNYPHALGLSCEPRPPLKDRFLRGILKAVHALLGMGESTP